ncbi:MAG: hypothetical protein ABFD62_01930 [Syntrophaceae bacterium]|jgi:hypothetical protein
MSTIAIKIDEGSTYTMQIKDEYTPEEFIAVFESYIKIISLITSSHKRIEKDLNLSWGLATLSSKVDELENEIKRSMDRVTALVLTDDSSIMNSKD